MNATEKKIMTVRAKSFSGFGVQTVRCQVDQDGTVRVYDDVAGHYTACHILSASAQRRIRKLAAK